MASRRFSQQLGTEMVKLVVGKGQGKRELLVHKDLIAEKIPMFNKLFNGPFNKAQTCSATFPEDNPLAFEFMVEWVYRGTFTMTTDKLQIGTKPSSLLIEIHLLATRYLLEELADRSLGALIEYQAAKKMFPYLANIPSYFEQSLKDSMLQKYLTQIWAFVFLNNVKVEKNRRSAEDFAQTLKQNDDFMVSFLKFAQEQSGEKLKDPRENDLCDFHIHEKADKCPYPMPSVSADSVTI